MHPVDAPTIRRVRAQLVGDPELAGRSLGRRLAQQTDCWLESLAADLPDGWALVATGGYARGVLTPGSDVDVVLLHPQRAAAAQVREVAEQLWYPMWDAGLKLSPGVHTAKSLLALAGDDLDTATSLLTLRCLAGSRAAVDDLHDRACEQWRRRPFVWLQRLHTSAQQRWARFGDVASLLEPDLKDGRGGLRDHDTIRWALQVERADVNAALENPFDDLAGDAELLLAARCELHRVTGRPGNVLLLQDQDRVAESMGFADADALMRTIAGAAHAVEWATERFWRRVERLVRTGGRAPGRSSRPVALEAGVVAIDDEVCLADDAEVDEQSFVFRFAAAAAHAGLPMDARSLRVLASRGTAPGEPWSERTRRSFVSLLGSGTALVPTVEALERYALFSRFLPEWRAVRSLPQRNAFHTFTVDRHLLQTVANAAESLRTVGRPDLLLLGALFHDIGKGYPGDHTEAGIELLDGIAARLGLAERDTAVVRALIEHHLLLPETATRRDLSDPRTAETIAAALGDTGTLDLLHALTVADSRATGPAAWSSWKESLLRELVAAARSVLEGAAPSRAFVLDDERMDRLARLVEADGLVHIETVEDDDPRSSIDVLTIAVRDRSGLFARIAGVLALHGCDVLGATATTRASRTPDALDVAVDEFRVARPSAGAPDWDRVAAELRRAIAGTDDIDARIEQRLRSTQRRRRPMAAAAPRREVLVNNRESATTTVVEVRAPDAPALLYRLSHTLAELGLDIRSAVVATLGHEVVDVFYVTEAGRQVDPERFEPLRTALVAALRD